MKREITFKSILLSASLFSLLAFAFVNFKANTISTRGFANIELSQNPAEMDDTTESREIKVPNVSVLGRLWDIAQNLMNKTH